MFTFLKGKKTYILAVLLGLATVAHALNWIDSNTFLTLSGLFTAGGAASIRDAISNS